MWHEKLQSELYDSGLPDAIDRLTNVIGRVNALVRKADTVIRLLREMATVYGCVLLQ
jgi:hypothetical protein